MYIEQLASTNVGMSLGNY